MSKYSYCNNAKVTAYHENWYAKGVLFGVLNNGERGYYESISILANTRKDLEDKARIGVSHGVLDKFHRFTDVICFIALVTNHKWVTIDCKFHNLDGEVFHTVKTNTEIFGDEERIKVYELKEGYRQLERLVS